jgi:hypothetical protein
MVQKSRARLATVGFIMLAVAPTAFYLPHFWALGIVLALTGAYLMVWATIGRGCWCKNCKKFGVF